MDMTLTLSDRSERPTPNGVPMRVLYQLALTAILFLSNPGVGYPRRLCVVPVFCPNSS